MPPGRRSIFDARTLNPFGPHQCFICSGSVKHFHTSSRCALSTRDSTKSSGIASSTSVGRPGPSSSLLEDDHPVHAELVGNHAEALCEECLTHRHGDLAAG